MHSDVPKVGFEMPKDSDFQLRKKHIFDKHEGNFCCRKFQKFQENDVIQNLI